MGSEPFLLARVIRQLPAENGIRKSDCGKTGGDKIISPSEPHFFLGLKTFDVNQKIPEVFYFDEIKNQPLKDFADQDGFLLPVRKIIIFGN